jgi:hypothetical protein
MSASTRFPTVRRKFYVVLDTYGVSVASSCMDLHLDHFYENAIATWDQRGKPEAKCTCHYVRCANALCRVIRWKADGQVYTMPFSSAFMQFSSPSRFLLLRDDLQAD